MSSKLLELCSYVQSENRKDAMLQQMQHRMALVDFWDVHEGWKVLEVGCGEGVMTVALADAVGDDGLVTAVDIDPPEAWEDRSHGGVSLGALTQRVLATAIGHRVEFRLGVDLLDPDSLRQGDHWDLVVFCMTSWYFDQPAQLGKLFSRLRPFADRLAYDEWDLMPQDASQLSHVLAILLQLDLRSLCRDIRLRNVRSLILPVDAQQMAVDSGWLIVKEKQMDSATKLHDGVQWEAGNAMQLAREYLNTTGDHDWAKARVRAQMQLLESFQARSNRKSLATRSFLAK